ncbi:MAG: S41 family peptidase [Bacteroidia bacterium]|nr:S41 family peptidase [Bacteroidia bacterium]
MKQLLQLLLFFTCLATAQSQTKKLSEPEKDFEKFWTTFKDNYAFFKLKGVNWDSTYIKYRPLITKKTTEKDLVSIFGQMVEPLKDGHITISKREEILYKGKKKSLFLQEFKGIEKQFWQTVNKTLLTNKFTEPKGIGPVFKEENLYYFSENPEFCYLRIARCFANAESVFDDKKEDADTKLMLALFDSLLITCGNKKALIIDLRTNGGGHGGIELASRFVKAKTLTHYKAIRQKGGYEKFTELEPNYIEPNKGLQFLKPVVILTSDKTASSAEDFTISLYQQSNVTTIGTNTSGMLSDMFGTDLSNKISFTLSNQCYYSTDKEILEDKGVPAKIEIKNSKSDITNGTDPVITKAIETLKG